MIDFKLFLLRVVVITAGFRCHGYVILDPASHLLEKEYRDRMWNETHREH